MWATPRALYPQERGLISILREAGRTPGTIFTRAANIAPLHLTGIRSPLRPARSQSSRSNQNKKTLFSHCLDPEDGGGKLLRKQYLQKEPFVRPHS
jgi:hypothetical protein